MILTSDKVAAGATCIHDDDFSREPMNCPVRSLLAIAIASACGLAHAEASPEPVKELNRLKVVGSTDQASEDPGSAAYLDAKTLKKHDYSDIQRALRQVTGVYVVDEEGYGLRPNIGIRGSGTDRNSRITVMEDGVLIAPAAYSAPSAYYFPTAARINAIEVRKGSSAIRSGPRTTGGAVNLISTPIPDDTSGLVNFAFGTDQTIKAHAWAGGSGEQTGWLIETVQQQTDGFKRLDGGGDTGYTLEDYLAKFRVNTGPNATYYQSLELKVGKTEQDSDETYLGLTDVDFRADPYRRYAASQLDNIQTDHELVELRHRIDLSDSIDLTTVAYRHDFARNWYKIDSVRVGTNSKSISAVLANPVANSVHYSYLTGTTSPNNAIALRNNNRSYYSQGVQSILGWHLGSGAGSHDLEIGVRWHRDNEDRFQDDDRYRMQDGTLILSSDGLPGSQDNRVGKAEAWSLYVQDEIRTGNWIITPGLRYESIDMRQTSYVKSPSGRDLAPTGVVDSSVDVLIPGLGVTWLLGEDFNVFASAHRGFNPPSPGSDADPEESINIEAGLRWNAGDWHSELAGFWNDYSNLVGTCTGSTGGNCNVGDQFDGGEARVRGIEATVGYDFGKANHWTVRVPVSLGYTFTDAEFRSSFLSGFEEWAVVNAGDELPYMPEHALTMKVGVEGERWRVNVAGNYIDDMRTVAGQGSAPASQRTESAFVVDLAAGFKLTDKAELVAKVENLTDEVWIASRRPAGVRPGAPRMLYLGMRVEF